MKIIIDGLTIEGSEIDFETLRIKFQMIGRAFEELVEVGRNAMCPCDCKVYCDSYYKQFGCYPYEVVIGRSYFSPFCSYERRKKQ